MTPGSVVIYGDFNSPWSYLAARRAERLAADGLQVDWRAVEHDPMRPSPDRAPSGRFDGLRPELDRVVSTLLPGEHLPHSLAGFVPYTKAAVAGYAEAYGAGVAPSVCQLLFEAFWINAIDLGDARLVRTLLVDAVRSGSSRSEALREWGYAVDVTGAPITTVAYGLISQWKAEWTEAGKEVVPVLMVDGGRPIFGRAAVRWLGYELVTRGLNLEPDPPPLLARRRARSDLPDLSWTSQHGSTWNRAYQDAHKTDMLKAG